MSSRTRAFSGVATATSADGTGESGDGGTPTSCEDYAEVDEFGPSVEIRVSSEAGATTWIDTSDCSASPDFTIAAPDGYDVPFRISECEGRIHRPAARAGGRGRHPQWGWGGRLAEELTARLGW